jgi:succinyl-diaminopimelate desuccinylase
MLAVEISAGTVRKATSNQNTTLDAVLQRIDKDEVVELTRSLVKIQSDYSEGAFANHNEIADFLAEKLRALGMDVHVLEPEPHYPIVIGRLKGTSGKPQLGIMGHYNTVPAGDLERWSVDPYEGEIRGDRLYGRGSTDQKGGIAAVLLATKAILDAGVPLRGDLVHAYIPGEGAQDHVLPHVVDDQRALIKADWYLDTDGGRDIIQVAAGHIWLKMIVKGQSAHPGGDTPWVNAAYKLAKVLVALEDVDSWMTYEKHPLFTSMEGKPRIEVGVLKAGTAVNLIPDIAEAQIDIRLNPKQTVPEVMAELNAVIDKVTAEDPDIDVSLEMLPGTQHVPYHHWAAITPDEPLVKVIREVAGKRLGRLPEFRGSRGGGRPDLWRMGTKWISWSANVGDNEHAPDEWVDIEGLYRSAQIYAEIILRMIQ